MRNTLAIGDCPAWNARTIPTINPPERQNARWTRPGAGNRKIKTMPDTHAPNLTTFQAPTPAELKHEALARAAETWRVFPLRAGTKSGQLLSSWKEEASSDPATVTSWWDTWPDANIGLSMDEQVSVVDVDPGADPEIVAKLPATYTVQTPRGGEHRYYFGQLPNTAGKIGAHIDTRGKDADGHTGYVLAPPSVADGKPYVVIDPRPVVPVPAWVTAACAGGAKAKVAAPEGVELDEPGNIQRGRNYLAEQAPLVVGEGADNRAYQTAAVLKDIGLGSETIEALLADWTDIPGLAEKAAHNAWQYGQNAPGVRAGQPVAKAFPHAAAGAAGADDGPELLQGVLAEPDEPIVEIVGGLIERGIGTYLKAPSDRFKSWLSYQIAVHVALGIDIWGRKVTQCAVVLLSYEDDRGEIRRRGKKIMVGLGRSVGPMPFHYWDLKKHRHGPLLTVSRDAVTTTPFWDRLRAKLATIDGHKLVVIDSGYNVEHFDEGVRNDDDQVNAAINKLEELCANCNASLLILYHPSRSGHTRGDMGGAQAWDSGPRARLALTRDGDLETDKAAKAKADAALVTLSVEKRSHGPKGPPIRLRFNGSLLHIDGAADDDAGRMARVRAAVLQVAQEAADVLAPLPQNRQADSHRLDAICQVALIEFREGDRRGRGGTGLEVRRVLEELRKAGELRFHCRPNGSHDAPAGYYRPIRELYDLTNALMQKTINEQEIRTGLRAGTIDRAFVQAALIAGTYTPQGAPC